MISREMVVLTSVGLHARPAAQFSQIAQNAGFAIKVGRDKDNLVNASSPLRLLTLKVRQGEKIIVCCETEDSTAVEAVFSQLQSCVSD
jgi:phosphocarrier protein